MARVAIAHVAADEFFARKIRTILAGHGYDVRLDTMAEPWKPCSALELEYSTADAVILLLSGQWVESDWAEVEVGWADYDDERVIPVLISGVGEQELSVSAEWLEDAIVVLHERPDFLDRFVDQLRAKLKHKLEREWITPAHGLQLFSDMTLDESVACFPPEMPRWERLRGYFDEVVRTYKHMDGAIAVFDHLQAWRTPQNISNRTIVTASEDCERPIEQPHSEADDAWCRQLAAKPPRLTLQSLVVDASTPDGVANEICSRSSEHLFLRPNSYRLLLVPHHCSRRATDSFEQCLSSIAGAFETSLWRDLSRHMCKDWAFLHWQSVPHARGECEASCLEVVNHWNRIDERAPSDILALSHFDSDHLLGLTSGSLVKLRVALEQILQRMTDSSSVRGTHIEGGDCSHEVDVAFVHSCLTPATGRRSFEGPVAVEEDRSYRVLSMPSGWTDDRIAELQVLWQAGHSASQIAGALGGGITRNQVIGKIHRLGLARSALPKVPSERIGVACTGPRADFALIGGASLVGVPGKFEVESNTPVDFGVNTYLNGPDALCLALTAWVCSERARGDVQHGNRQL